MLSSLFYVNIILCLDSFNGQNLAVLKNEMINETDNPAGNLTDYTKMTVPKNLVQSVTTE